MDKYSTIAALRDELGGERPSRLRATYDALLATEDRAKEEMFVAAVIPLLDALLRGNMREVAERLQMQLPANEKDGGAVGRERIAAAELRSKIRNRRQQDVPESVKIAVSAHSQFVGIFSCILGFNANLLSRADYERRYLTGTHPDPIAIAPNWLIRTAFALAPANRRK